MKEKQFMRWMAKRSIAIIVCFVVAIIAVQLFMPNQLKETTYNFSNIGNYTSASNLGIDDFTIKTEPAGVIDVTAIEHQKDTYYMTITSNSKGTSDVQLEIILNETGQVIDSTLISVNKNGVITDESTGNFSNFRGTYIAILLMMAAFAILLWAGYVKARRELVFSYQSIFCIGLAIWITITVLVLVFGTDSRYMLSVYTTIANAPRDFVMITSPAIVIFAVAMIISNISLIRHERFRTRNALAALLAMLMIVGLVLLILVMSINISGSQFQVDTISSIIIGVFAIYAILECFLAGAIICGAQAARHKPKFDKDYIVILGCMIRADGTLYPLIRGRVDRGIKFYREQLAATGKKAIFVPSGGKGSNEPISEAEAMKRYLIEQGIEPEQIRIEEQSFNTRQNMQFSKRIIGEDAKAVFSTTNFHVFRSGIISRQVDFQVDGMGSPTKWYFWPNAYVRELIGMLSYKWKSLVLVIIPTIIILVSVIFFTD